MMGHNQRHSFHNARSAQFWTLSGMAEDEIADKVRVGIIGFCLVSEKYVPHIRRIQIAWIPCEIVVAGDLRSSQTERARKRGIPAALLRKSRLRHESPFPLRHHATRMISAVPRAEKRFISATRIWISAVWLSGCLAAMRSPKALRHRIFASIRLLAWYPVHRFQNARP